MGGFVPNVKKVGASLFQGEASPASSRADRRVERLPRVLFRSTRTAKGAVDPRASSLSAPRQRDSSSRLGERRPEPLLWNGELPGCGQRKMVVGFRAL